ncbi:MAG: glycerol-3-phosphate 1-O-acyltransferase PlsY [Roseovarius sp.]|nr:glycerol-3-phosphate 1-O-acyltransferase PlsY [Roseovarius sp.]
MPPIETSALLLLVWAVLGYLIGSISGGMAMSRVFGLGNLRDIGSGNIGATNVLRTGNKTAAAGTLLMDAAKGAVVALLAWAVTGQDAAQVAGFMAFVGHCYPIWLGFKGGKGVATFLGILLALAWPVGIAACLTWLVVAAVTRISSFAAIFAAATSTIWMAFLGQGHMLLMGALLTLLVFWRHRANIQRLRVGTEPKIGQK